MAKNFKGQYQSQKEMTQRSQLSVSIEQARIGLARFFALWSEAVQRFTNACRYAAERMRERCEQYRKELAQ